tara:strand:- start:27653 stop:28027 length:375 start_codon:yes stop_codon:yes gene_type:complete
MENLKNLTITEISEKMESIERENRVLKMQLEHSKNETEKMLNVVQGKEKDLWKVEKELKEWKERYKCQKNSFYSMVNIYEKSLKEKEEMEEKNRTERIHLLIKSVEKSDTIESLRKQIEPEIYN